jgi:hypothetical protein
MKSKEISAPKEFNLNFFEKLSKCLEKQVLRNFKFHQTFKPRPSQK